MLKIGLIGAGWHATADHAPALRYCADGDAFRGRVELTGVCDIDHAKAADVAARFGFRRAYESLDAMLGDVDAVLSIVPPAAMAATLQPIVQHSRPVLIEKPLGRDVVEARDIAAMLQGHPHMISLNRRFDPGVTIARRWMAAQSRPRVAHGIMMRRDRREPDFAWSTGIHLADLLCFLAGPLQFTGGRRNGSKRVGCLAGDDNLRGIIELWPVTRRVAELIHLSGDGWSMRIEVGTHQPWRVMCRRNGAVEIDAAPPDAATPSFVRNGTADETATFLRGLLTRDWSGPTLADALEGTLIAASMHDLIDAPAYHGTPQ